MIQYPTFISIMCKLPHYFRVNFVTRAAPQKKIVTWHPFMMSLVPGPEQLCALDLLSSAGLINYFGRNNSLKQVNITPLLLEKGLTKLAIFGLSSIKDERLFRLFKENRVR